MALLPFGGGLQKAQANTLYAPNNAYAYNCTESSLYWWRIAYEKLRNGLQDAKIMAIGDSISFGVNSGSNTSEYYSNGWPVQLAKMFSIQQPNYVPSQLTLSIPNLPSNSDDRWSYTAPFTNNVGGPWGVVNQCHAVSSSGWSGSSGTVTFNPSQAANLPITCDSFDIYTVDNTAGGNGTFSCSVNGGTAQTFTLTGNNGLAIHNVTCPSASTSNSVVIQATDNTKTSVIVAIEPRLSTKFQLRIGNPSSPGAPASQWFSTVTTIGNTSGLGIVQTFSPSLAIILLGTNDGNALETPATFQADMQAGITFIKTALPQCSILLLSSVPTNTAATQALLIQYQPVYQALALANNCAYIDIFNGRFAGTYDTNWINGFHPYGWGYGDMANTIYNVLTNA